MRKERLKDTWLPEHGEVSYHDYYLKTDVFEAFRNISNKWVNQSVLEGLLSRSRLRVPLMMHITNTFLAPEEPYVLKSWLSDYQLFNGPTDGKFTGSIGYSSACQQKSNTCSFTETSISTPDSGWVLSRSTGHWGLAKASR
ncbi:hypothetical protein CHS0354_023303 [Potamilus streckersoni]|uniref:Uncharacterized protein n=1 Tax=Potamilus streckersoni TaxID=2493646 RepID=A0AAE0T5R2_9BIVA|nr:hypothetical protein CHS0354_023303 [Potamilus streckersoni]